MFLLASAATGRVTVLLALRVLAGASGAVSFIVGGALATQLGHGKAPARSALLLGVYFDGGGLGIALSGVAIPPLLAARGPAAGWRWGWVLLTALSVLAAVPAARCWPTAPPASAPDCSCRWSSSRRCAGMPRPAGPEPL